jgi:predicted ArsR family transcriptional regulator
MTIKGVTGETRTRILEALALGDVTAPQLAAELGLHKNTVGHHIKALHDAHKIYVVDYHQQVGTSGDWARIYRLGEGKDKKPPKADSKLHHQRHYTKKRALIRSRAAAQAGAFIPITDHTMNHKNGSAASKICAYLKDYGPAHSIEIRETLGLSAHAVRIALHKLTDRGFIEEHGEPILAKSSRWVKPRRLIRDFDEAEFRSYDRSDTSRRHKPLPQSDLSAAFFRMAAC